MTPEGRWVEVGDGVFARRYAELDLTVGLVVGTRGCLVIDTRADPTQGAELAAAVRQVTALPWTVAITHGHYDHCLGTAALLPCPVWAHPRMRSVGHLPPAHPPAHLVPASHQVGGVVELDLGERRVRLSHLGRGHTDHDVVAWLPDEQVLFAGDLVEQGAPPDYEDADPVAWPATLDALFALRPATVVPGHGDPVDAAFVATQRAEIAELTRLCRAVCNGDLDEAAAWARSPYPADVSRAALLRYRFHT